MGKPATKRQNFDVTPEQEAEIGWLREALGAPTAKDTLLRAVRIASILAREARSGRVLMLGGATGPAERLIVPELEHPAAGEWKYLVQREHPWRRQMSVKGRRLLAATVWRDMVANSQAPAEAAEEWGIPVEAVLEAVRWCEANRGLLDLEAQEERRRLAATGTSVAAAG
ncbi:hypothetical protein L6R50_11740 [Myxococcota bacterium]|nr:hypothetical protein [Myxococcota bacterium]